MARVHCTIIIIIDGTNCRQCLITGRKNTVDFQIRVHPRDRAKSILIWSDCTYVCKNWMKHSYFRSHLLQRTRQVTRCAHCEHLVIFDALKCSMCGIVWHKKCLGSVTVYCGPSARRLTESSDAQRRMSIFGVPLKGHLEAQQRKVPIILEKCIDEIQKRGVNCKVE